MLPNKKLKISIVKPSERLIKTNPTAIPDESKTATDASPEILNLFLILVITSALPSETAYAVHNG
jgi:hypothetical protein